MAENEQELTETERAELFEAGIAAAKGVVAPADEVTEGEPPDDTPAEETDETAEEDGGKPSPDPVVFGGLTEAQLIAVLAKANELDSFKAGVNGEHQKIYGKFGELQKAIKQLSEGKPAKITAESMKRMHEEYPDLADALAEDLAGLVLERGGESVSATDIEGIVNARLADRVSSLTKEFAVDLLTVRHPDWQEKKESPEWKLWVGTLPPERKLEVDSSQDWKVAAKLLDDFDTWKRNGKQAKTNRLERAMTPTGSSPEPSRKILSPEAQFEEGRKKAFKQRGILRN